MRKGLAYSLALHALVVVLALVGTWFVPEPLPLEETPILVDLVDIAEVRNLPPAAAGRPEGKPEVKAPPKVESTSQANPEPAPKAKPEPAPAPPPAPKPEAKPPPKPEPKPEVKKAKESLPPEPKPSPPKEKPEVEKPQPSSPVAAVKPAAKPEPVTDFASVLKTVQGMQQKRPPDSDGEAAKKPPPAPPADAPPSFDEQVAKALASRTAPGFNPSLPITATEIDLVRRQIEACWNVPAGARDAAELIIHIRVEMNPDGTPRMASVVEEDRMRGDPFFRAAAESALRAVLNPRCHPFKLPADKYERWRTMTLVFNPREMLGT
jgi:outer membrane biosynthesis protein TonB